jgi:hypothetical protein
MKSDQFDELDEFLERLFGSGFEPSAEACVTDSRIKEFCDRLGARIGDIRAQHGLGITESENSLVVGEPT